MLEDILDTVICADSLDFLRTLPDNSLDALCTDPPSGINFMSSKWDSDKGGRRNWVAWFSKIMAESFRVLKPGASAFVWSLPRTSYWTALGLEKAGFEIRDCVYDLIPGDTKLLAFLEGLNEEQQEAFYQLVEANSSPFLLSCFGSGFPKNLDIAKMIDKHLKAERKVIGHKNPHDPRTAMARATTYQGFNQNGPGNGTPITAPATSESARFQGWGSALKPAVEVWWLVRKPLSEKTVAQNVLKWGTGGINIDATRVNTSQEKLVRSPIKRTDNEIYGTGLGLGTQIEPQGRWPAHLVLTHSPGCVLKGTTRIKANGGENGDIVEKKRGVTYDIGKLRSGITHREANGLEEIDHWECVEQCPVRLMNEQSGERKGTRQLKARAGSAMFNGTYNGGEPFYRKDDTVGGYNDQGGASRYFTQIRPDIPFLYHSKAGRKERNAGCETLPEKSSGVYGEFVGDGRGRQTEHTPERNNHPTVKSLSLLKHLLLTITPENGVVLDPFFGSGSVGVAALEKNFHFIGIEVEESYCKIAQARIDAAKQKKEKK